nr:hypothetical protein [Streptomyces sp. rh34]
MVVGQRRRTPEKASDVLRTASQHRDIKPRALCAELGAVFGASRLNSRARVHGADP